MKVSPAPVIRAACDLGGGGGDHAGGGGLGRLAARRWSPAPGDAGGHQRLGRAAAVVKAVPRISPASSRLT